MEGVEVEVDGKNNVEIKRGPDSLGDDQVINVTQARLRRSYPFKDRQEVAVDKELVTRSNYRIHEVLQLFILLEDARLSRVLDVTSMSIQPGIHEVTVRFM